MRLDQSVIFMKSPIHPIFRQNSRCSQMFLMGYSIRCSAFNNIVYNDHGIFLARNRFWRCPSNVYSYSFERCSHVVWILECFWFLWRTFLEVFSTLGPVEASSNLMQSLWRLDVYQRFPSWHLSRTTCNRFCEFISIFHPNTFSESLWVDIWERLNSIWHSKLSNVVNA